MSNSLLNIDGLRLASVEDIIPMKLLAIANRGTKKDFYDLYFLLQTFSLEQMLNLFSIKFKTVNSFHLIKSLVFFEDAELDPEPVLIKKVSWDKVKSHISKAVETYLNL